MRSPARRRRSRARSRRSPSTATSRRPVPARRPGQGRLRLFERGTTASGRLFSRRPESPPGTRRWPGGSARTSLSPASSRAGVSSSTSPLSRLRASVVTTAFPFFKLDSAWALARRQAGARPWCVCNSRARARDIASCDGSRSTRPPRVRISELFRPAWVGLSGLPDARLPHAFHAGTMPRPQAPRLCCPAPSRLKEKGFRS